jgi:SsrA-binding protein
MAQYTAGAPTDDDPTRPRKLLLHKDQIRRLSSQVSEKGLTLVPLRLYIRHHVAKVELGLGRGRRQHDKRQAIIERDREREARQAIGRQ